MRRAPPLLGLLAALAFAGCVSGPDYFGGPRADEPHGVVSPGKSVTVWEVDGQPTGSTSFSLKLAPGPHRLLVRLEHPMESDAAEPFEMIDLPLQVEAGWMYLLELEPAELPPYEVEVRAGPIP